MIANHSHPLLQQVALNAGLLVFGGRCFVVGSADLGVVGGGKSVAALASVENGLT
jgi:hypothetical protein